MKVRKILIGTLSVFVIALVLVLNLTKQKVEAADEQSSELTLSEVVAKYYNEGVYTKKTQIHLNEAAVTEISTYFHGKVQKDRTTYYNGEFLLMGDLDGGFDEINSGYRTNESGTLNHFRIDSSKVVENKLDITDLSVYSKDSYAAGESLHNFYVTLDKLSQEGYFDGWTSNTYVVENKADEYLLDFLAFVAPCLEDTILDTNYITSSAMTLSVSEECNAYLSLKMYVGIENKGTVDNDELLLAEARVYRGNKQFSEYTYTINHLDANTLEPVANAKEVMLGYNDMLAYNGYYTYVAPSVEGMVPSHDYINFTVDGENLVSNIYYSEVDKLTSDTVASESLSGSGTETDPYLIQSASDMLYFQANGVGLGKVYFKLTKSIELEVPNFKIAETFAGTFDGNNCSIRGISVNASSGKTSGLFYAISGEVKNLSIYGSVTETTAMYVGGLVYYCSGKITNCTNYCDVTSGFTGESRVGGIVGYLVNGGNLTNCVNYGSITSAGSRVGGLVGHATAGNANNCVNYGVVTGINDVGGIWGYAQGAASLINGCVNYGDVICSSTSKTSHNGGIIAYASIKGISDCINYGSVKSNGYSGSIAGRYNNTNPFTGCVNYGTVEGRTNSKSHSTWSTFSIVAYCTSANFVAVSNCYEYGVIIDKA